MNNNISLGPVIIMLQDLLHHNSLFKTWSWKLDSFFERDIENNPDIHVKNNKSINLDSSFSFNQINLLQDEITGFFNKQICMTENGFYFRLYRRSIEESSILYHVDLDWKEITLLEDHSDTLGQFAFEYLSNILPFAMLKKNVLTFHGVLMEYNGQGIIFSANSGVGKTTHARLWKKHKNSFIINGDKSSCYKKDGVWTGFGTPWCGTSGEYMNREVPIKAIVLIERGSENYAEKIKPFTGFKRLLEHTLYPAWEENLANQAMDLLSDFIDNIPVYRLECLPDKESVEVLAKEIFQN